jgi:uncharacterized protein (TIGR03435 family)
MRRPVSLKMVLFVLAAMSPRFALKAQGPVVTNQKLSFEVASVKPNESLDSRGMIGPRPGGRIAATNVPARLLITFAYHLKPYELSGGPAWIAADRFDMDAKALGDPPIEQLRTMLQALLAERFQLVIHSETRQIDGFVLARMRPDRLGPGLHQADLDCSKSFTEAPCRDGFYTPGHVKFVGMPMLYVVETLSSIISGPILDETKLTGAFDGELQWSPDATPLPDLPGIFTAIQEQLELKVQPKKVASEVFVIDHIEHPTPN